MKMTKKKVFTTALVVSLLAILSVGTLAWFSAQDSVENDFYIATSEDVTADDIFSVSVYETTPAGAGDEDGYEYKDILPGDVLTKKVEVKNTGYYEQYIRVTVTISDAQAWIAAVGEDIDMASVFVGFDETKWSNISKSLDTTADTLTYVLYYTDILESEETITLFESVKIPETLTQAQAAAFGTDGFAVSVVADAVQTANVGDTAYAAFQTVEGANA